MFTWMVFVSVSIIINHVVDGMMQQLRVPVPITPEITDEGRQSLERWLKNLVVTVRQYELNEITRIIDNASIWPINVKKYGNIEHLLSVLKSRYEARIKAIGDHNTLSKCIGLRIPNLMHETWILEREIDMENESKSYMYPMVQMEIRAQNENGGSGVTVMRKHIQKHDKKIELEFDVPRNMICCVRLLYQEEEFFDFNPSESGIHVKDFYLKSVINISHLEDQSRT